MQAGIPSGLIGGAIALGLLIGGTWWFGGVLHAKDEAFGDIPHLPEGVAAARNLSGGGRSCIQAAAGESHSQQNKSNRTGQGL